jgi:catechol 2,3-dioxygenase-like lactoylglutathione lyase family enzyme
VDEAAEPVAAADFPRRHGPDEALCDRVRLRRPHRRLHDPDAFAAENLIGSRVDLQPRRSHVRARTAYGHIAVGVDDLDVTLAALHEQGIEPEREPYRVREGGSLLCFARDPDG